MRSFESRTLSTMQVSLHRNVISWSNVNLTRSRHQTIVCLNRCYDTHVGDGFASKCPNQQQVEGMYVHVQHYMFRNSYGTMRTQVHGSGSWAATVTAHAHAHKSLDVIWYLRMKGMHAHPQNRSKSQKHTTDASLRHLQIDTSEGDHGDK